MISKLRQIELFHLSIKLGVSEFAGHHESIRKIFNQDASLRFQLDV